MSSNKPISFQVPVIKSPSYIKYIITGCSIIFLIVIGIIYQYKNVIIEKLKILWISPNNSLQQLEGFIRGEEANPIYNPLELENNIRGPNEIPRNKIQLKREIDRGAFGKVFFAKMFDLHNNTGECSLVAVKQLRGKVSFNKHVNR